MRVLHICVRVVGAECKYDANANLDRSLMQRQRLDTQADINWIFNKIKLEKHGSTFVMFWVKQGQT